MQKNIMQKFSIYIESNKFHWSTNKIIYSIIFLCCGILLFKEKFLQLEKDFIDEILMALMIGVLIFALIIKFINFTNIESLNGKLEGFLSFNMDSITVGDEIYLLEKIRTIKISNEDFTGKLVNTTGGNFGPALSNGTNNFIIIFFESGKPKRIQFKINNSSDFQKIKPELINLYHCKKIDFEELALILNVKGSQKREQLKVDAGIKHYC